MELVGDRYAPAHAHRWRESAGSPQHPPAGITVGRAVEMHHLRRRMHAGVGPAGADDFDRHAGDERQGFLHRRLYGRLVAPLRLATLVEALPTGEFAAVVLDPERKTAQSIDPEFHWIRCGSAPGSG